MNDNTTKELVQVFSRLPKYIKVLYKIYRLGGFSKTQKIMLYGAIGYVLSPIDLIPGVIPVFGQLDDAIVVILTIYKIVKSCKSEKIDQLLVESKLNRDILKRDVDTLKNYAKVIGISTAKIITAGLKFVGRKGIRIIETSVVNLNRLAKN